MWTGVAISDPGALLARPVEVVPAGEIKQYLRGLLADEPFSEVVVGVPKTLGGEVGFQARRVLQTLRGLEEAFPGVRFVQWDERMTTRVARSAAGVSRGPRKGGRKKSRRGGVSGRERVDHVAAAAMLQEYLDRRGAFAGPRR